MNGTNPAASFAVVCGVSAKSAPPVVGVLHDSSLSVSLRLLAHAGAMADLRQQALPLVVAPL